MADRIIKPDSGNDVVIQNNGGTRKIEVTNSGNIEFVGDLGFTSDTDSKIKLPSAGGLYESDGSTEILTESSGAVSLKNTAIDSSVTMSANQSAVKTAINASGSAPIYACRAWVNFNGSGTLAVNGSANVSSVTDNSSGLYTINFSTAMSDTNYCFTTGIQQEDPSYVYDVNAPASGTITSSALQLETSSQNGGTTLMPRDTDILCVAIFR